MARVDTQNIPAPTNVKATVLTPNSVKVTWNLSADVSDYLISCTTTASYAGGRNVIVNGGDKTSYTFNNLVKNTPYVITVQGLTKDGRKSICSNEVLLKTSTIAPSSPPRDICITTADPARLKVSWQPPSKQDCNGSITGYVIQYTRVGSHTLDDTMIVNVSDDINLAISGLFACAKYSVTVAAVNANGTGPFSNPMVATSGEDRPSAPQSLKILNVTSTSATLQWMPPEYPNGIITKYSVHFDERNIDPFGDVSNKMMSIVEALSPDTDYVFEMKAYTKIGSGSPSYLHVKTCLPAPTNVKATVLTPNSVEVTWDQSSDVTGYLISCTSPASYAGNRNVMVNGGDTTSDTLTNLVENTPYDIYVQGLARDGRKSDCSTEVSITTQKAAPSLPPQDIKVASADPASLLVSWQKPLDKTHNEIITGYVIRYARVGSDDNMIVNVPNDPTFTIKGIFACVEYSVTMAAVNVNGTGPFSKPFLATSGEDTPSEPQQLEVVTITSTTVKLQWMPPKYPNGVITRYSIHYNGIDTNDFGEKVPNMMMGVVEGLSPYTTYVLEMKAHTRVGPGPPISLTVKTRLPAPTNVKATVLTPNSVEVTWDQSPDVTGYLISCTSSASYASGKSVRVTGGDTTSHTLTDLVENTPYGIHLHGLTREGRKSDCSTKVPITTQKAAPSSPPQDISVASADPATLIVSWKPPLETDSSMPITGYVVRYARVGSNDTMIVNVSNDTTLIMPGLFAYVKYSVIVAAVNANGTGPFSKPVVETSGEDVPNEPQQLETDTVTSTSVTLKWQPPMYPNGVIKKYSVHCDGKNIDEFGDPESHNMIDTIKELMPDSDYVIEIKAHTRVGSGTPLSLLVRTAKSSAETGRKRQISDSSHIDDETDATAIKGKKKKVDFSDNAITLNVAKIFLIPVGSSEKIECDGRYGGSYLWEGHDFAMMLPPGCADENITINLQAYLPSSTQEHCLSSAVFDITTNIKKFKKPVTVRFPHCMRVRSEKDKENLWFIIFHEDSYEFKKGDFEIGKSFGSTEIEKFSKLSIGEITGTIFTYLTAPLRFFVTSLKSICTSTKSQNVTMVGSSLKEGYTSEINIQKNTKVYVDFLILPEGHEERKDWHGTYCIAQDIPTYWQAIISYFKEQNWINPSRQVLKRQVTFVEPTNDATAEICVVDKSADGKIITFGQECKISKQKIDYLDLNSFENDTQSGSNNESLIENEYQTNFPRCVLLINGKLSLISSRLRVNGLCGISQESSEFNLAYPTKVGYGFEVYDHTDPRIVKKKPFKPQELIVHQNKVTKTTMYLSWREPTPSDESIIGYELEYRKNGEDFKKVAKKSLRPEDLCHKATGLSAYTRYGFRVAAFNSAGTGPFTDVVTQFTKFDYPAAADRLKNQFSTLIKLKYDSMKSFLYQKRVITDNERKEIDTRTGDEKMTYLIADIIIPSLNANLSKKYKYFLESMEQSDDIALKSIAEKLGGSQLVPE